MTSVAADLTDRVIPFVPTPVRVERTTPLRYLLAYDHDRRTAVLRIFIRALHSFYRRRARKLGISDGRTGTVTFIQRFGSAANLNIHFHVIALDGVFTEGRDGKLTIHTASSPSDDELPHLVRCTGTRVQRHLLRCGLSNNSDEVEEDPVRDASAVLASCYAGSVQGRQTLGGRQGAKLRPSWRRPPCALARHEAGVARAR